SDNVTCEPAGEIPWAMWGRRAHVAQISGAISGRNVHAAAECNSQVRVVATNAFALVEDLPRRLGCARVFIAELNVVMYKIANCLNALPSERLLLKEPPVDIGHP